MSGSSWIEANGRTLSPLGADVADMLSRVYQGIYHIDRDVLHKRVQWDNERCIELVVHGEMATHDGAELAHLVMQCAAYAVRLSVSGAAPGYLRLRFTRGDTMFMGKVRTPQRLVDDFTYSLSEVIARAR